MVDIAAINQLSAQGRHQEAISAAKKMLKQYPGSVQAKAGFAFAHFQAGKFSAALKTYRELHRQLPDQVDFLYGMALSFDRLGELAKSEEAYERLIRMQPQNIAFLVNFGVVLRRMKKFDQSVTHLRQAVALAPNEAEVINNLAITQQYQEDYETALETYAAVLQINPQHHRAMTNMGVVHMTRGHLEEAQQCYEKALVIDPGYIKALNNLGLVHVYQGRTDEAETVFRRAITVNPDDGKAYNSLINLALHQSSLDLETIRLFSDLEVKFNSKSNLADPDHAAFALARFYEKQKDTEKARQYYREGNTLVSRNRPYDDHKNLQLLKTITSIAERLPEYDPGQDRGKGLLFIVGMPRSGTTLLESIIASHPQIVAGDELFHLDHICQKVLERTARTDPVSDQDLHEISNYYLEKTASLRQDGMMMIDKMPHNFQWVDFILKIFPEAKVLHSYRDAMDNCLSLYKTYFDLGHHYSFSMKPLGSYFVLYQRFMARIHAEHGNRLIAVNYDDIVTDPVAASRPVFDYIGYPDFTYEEKNRGTDYFSKTASSVQVQQPITSGSVGGWRRHEEFLQPVLHALMKQQARYGLPQYGDGGFPFRQTSPDL